MRVLGSGLGFRVVVGFVVGFVDMGAQSLII